MPDPEEPEVEEDVDAVDVAPDEVVETPEEEVGVETPEPPVNYREKYGLGDLPEGDEEAIYRQLADSRKQADNAEKWRLLHAQSVSELNQERQRQQAEVERARQYQAYQQQQAEIQAAQPKWETVPFDLSWASQIKVNEDGTVSNPELYERFQKGLQWKDKTVLDFVNQPGEFIHKVYGQQMAQHAQYIAQQTVHQILGEMQKQQAVAADSQFVKSFVDENADWLCQKDHAGNVIKNHEGAPVFNEFGQQFDQRIIELVKYGLPLKEATKTAYKEFKADALEYEATQTTAKTAVIDQNAAKKAAFLKKGSRNGAQPKPGQRSITKVDDSNVGAVLMEQLAHLPPEDFLAH